MCLLAWSFHLQKALDLCVDVMGGCHSHLWVSCHRCPGEAACLCWYLVQWLAHSTAACPAVLLLYCSHMLYRMSLHMKSNMINMLYDKSLRITVR